MNAQDHQVPSRGSFMKAQDHRGSFFLARVSGPIKTAAGVTVGCTEGSQRGGREHPEISLGKRSSIEQENKETMTLEGSG